MCLFVDGEMGGIGKSIQEREANTIIADGKCERILFYRGEAKRKEGLQSELSRRQARKEQSFDEGWERSSVTFNSVEGETLPSVSTPLRPKGLQWQRS